MTKYKPCYIVSEDNGELIEIHIDEDVMIKESKPGYKAGNPIIDEVNEQLKEEGIIEKLKNLYKKD